MKRFFKIIKNLILAVVLVLGLSFGVVCFFSVYERPLTKSDAVIILGAAINTPALNNRSLQGLKLFKEGKTDVLVLSGGRISDKDISEAGYMKKIILKNSTNQPNLILEENSHTTFENIQNAKKLIPNAKSVTIVSDKYHLARAVLLAKRFGFSEVYWSAPDSGYYPREELYYHYFRETIALISYVPKLIFK